MDSTLQKQDLIAIRDFTSEDKNFIYSTFLRGLYYDKGLFNYIPKDIFMTNYHAVLSNLLASPNTKITVACLKEDPEVILGYTITNKDNTILHWMFTKKAWRNIGIAKTLFKPTINTVTHVTQVGLSIMRKKHQNSLVFNPFALN